MNVLKQAEASDHLLTNSLENAPQKSLTRQELLASFQFSQGDPTLQNWIFKYMKSLHPSLQISKEEQAVVAEASLRPAQTIVNNPQRHTSPQKLIFEQIMRELGAAQTVFKSQQSDYSREEIVRYIADGIVVRDFKYLVKPD